MEFKCCTQVKKIIGKIQNRVGGWEKGMTVDIFQLYAILVKVMSL